MRNFFLVSLLPLLALTVLIFLYWPSFWWLSILFLAYIGLGIHDMTQRRHAILRNFPIIGHFRYFLESFRPEIMQYFVETDTEGRPFNRIWRSLIYQRAKNVTATSPFGTQMDVYSTGYEWLEHSMYPIPESEMDSNPRVLIGGPDCQRPYSSSLLNVSAMSYGSLSKNAVMALNGGAAIGRFSHNTGEGSLSPFHEKMGGDIVWQIGTGYFGCRTPDGHFDPDKFTKKANIDQVKMIEIKLSQGAKPGHGGILPAAKNTPEIAAIRGVEPHTSVHSPPYHKAFDSPKGLMEFVFQLRLLSGGKPVGIKLCIGREEEFEEIVQAMITTGIKPDFITVDGGEGGTGAAPVEFSNSLGMPLRDGLAFVHNRLTGYDLKKDIKIIASGKIVTGYHIARAIALGADACNSARGMMISVGCIQALQCNMNTCPTGVATQDPKLYKGLVVEDKKHRVASFHQNTIQSFVELMAAAGFKSPEEIQRKHINRRVSMSATMTYEELYPSVKQGAYLSVDLPSNSAND